MTETEIETPLMMIETLIDHVSLVRLYSARFDAEMQRMEWVAVELHLDSAIGSQGIDKHF